jgi:hypothetical protein
MSREQKSSGLRMGTGILPFFIMPLSNEGEEILLLPLKMNMMFCNSRQIRLAIHLSIISDPYLLLQMLIMVGPKETRITHIQYQMNRKFGKRSKT